jgi:hypothetical protein
MRRSCRKTGAQRITGKITGNPGGRRSRRNYRRDCHRRKSSADIAMPVDSPKDRAAIADHGEPCGFLIGL